jgi:putative flippase GtrA
MNILSSEYGVCYLIALVLSVIWNFTFNRKYTFKSATNVPIAMLKVFGFYRVFTPVTVVLGELVSRATTWEYAEYVILGVTMMANMVTEFLYCKHVVYKGSENTLDEDDEDDDLDEELEKDAKEEIKKAKKKACKQEKKRIKKAKKKAKKAEKKAEKKAKKKAEKKAKKAAEKAEKKAAKESE